MVKERLTEEEIAQIESSAVLSDLGIEYERRQRRIVIEPFSHELLSTSSYDLTLGENYFVKTKTEPGILNIYHPETVRKIWGDAQKARLTRSLKEKSSFIKEEFWKGIEDEDRVILIPSRGVLLIHSEEFVGAKEGYTIMVRSKSTLERLGVTIAISAGWGDVGFVNRWTFLLTNEHASNEVPLKVGMPFAQIIFIRCVPIGSSYVKKSGKYQKTEDFAELVSSWQPEDMLPKVLE